MPRNNILFLLITVFLFSCKNGESGESTEESATVNNTFQSIPRDLAMKIYNEADLLDYIFHDLPFSMSQDQQASIRANVAYIGQVAQPEIPEGCKPIARQFYGSQGDIFLEADIYFSESCRFYVFLVDGKAAYANKMSDEGVKFFDSMIRQALKASGGGG